MLSPQSLKQHFAAATEYGAYVASGRPNEQENWRAFHARVRVTTAQQSLLSSFTRRINVLCVSGTWCGDCVQQCPMLDHIARAAPPGMIDFRLIDRDARPELAESVRICGGARVPVVLFLNEDFEFLGLGGDRTLARYRALAGRLLGAACPLPGAPVAEDEVAGTLQDWVDETERVQLMLRLSPKMRQRYGD